MDKKENFIERNTKRVSQSIQEVYKECLKAPPENREGQQKTGLPHLKPNQSTKSTVEEGIEAVNNLDHAQRLQRKYNLSPRFNKYT